MAMLSTDDRTIGSSETYQAVPEAVPAARHALLEFAARAGASDEQLDSIALAASEAITNAVEHAYGDEAGPLYVGAWAAQRELCVLVADDGRGLNPRVESHGLGIGLRLIATLCDEFTILKRSHGGTELRMWFALSRPARGRQPRGSLASAITPARSSFSTTT